MGKIFSHRKTRKAKNKILPSEDPWERFGGKIFCSRKEWPQLDVRLVVSMSSGENSPSGGDYVLVRLVRVSCMGARNFF